MINSIRHIPCGAAAILAFMTHGLASCGGETPVSSPSEGSVQVSAETTGHDVDPDGYTVVVAGQSEPIPANGQVTVDGLPMGTANVELTGVAPNCNEHGPNPRSVTVPDNATVATTFQVTCLGSGSLQVTVETTGEDLDPDGYTVHARDSTRGSAVNAQVTVSGLLEGTASVALEGVAPNCQVAGSNPRDVTIPVNSTVAVTFTIACSKTSWHAKAGMPTARLGLATAVVNGIVYAIGGYAEERADGLTTVEAYDPTTDTWTSRAAMPTGRRWLSAAAVNSVIYVIGGHVDHLHPGLMTVEAYDPATNTWTTRSNMPTGRLGATAAVANGKIYVMGGALGPTGPLTTAVEEYDPATDTWTSRADMPTARALMLLEAANGKLYAIGGGSPTVALSTVEVYDPASDAWSFGLSMPLGRATLCGGLVDGRIYAIGGRDPEAPTFNAVSSYEPAANAWTSGPAMPTARWGLACAIVADKIYAIGGSSVHDPPHPGLKTVEEFDPSIP